jgi:hypothetical protein
MQITDFTANTLLVTTAGNNLWEIRDDLIVQVNMPAQKGYRFTIKKGFITNFRSGTDLLNPFVPRIGENNKSITYAVHDAMYSWVQDGKILKHLMPKEQADDLLKAMLEFCDDCIKYQIKDLRRLAADGKNSKEQIAYYKQEIKLLDKEFLGGFKIWTIWKAVRWFGGSAYKEPMNPPYDKNVDKIFLEVL